jgi:hypothetical protein
VANNVWKTGNEKTLKVYQLSGAVANQACPSQRRIAFKRHYQYGTII